MWPGVNPLGREVVMAVKEPDDSAATLHGASRPHVANGKANNLVIASKTRLLVLGVMIFLNERVCS
jgi:hypothetical protein